MGWGGGGWGGLGVIIESNLNQLSCCWVGVGLGCDNIALNPKALNSYTVTLLKIQLAKHMPIKNYRFFHVFHWLSYKFSFSSFR